MRQAASCYFVAAVLVHGCSGGPTAPTPPAASSNLPVPGKTLVATQGQVISNLTLTSNEGPCVVVQGVGDVWIDHARIGPCAGRGIVVANASRIRITNSIIRSGHGGDARVDDGDGVFVVDSTDILIQGNQFSDNESSVVAVGSRNTSIIGNYSLNPLGPYPRGQHFALANGSDQSQITDNFGEQVPRFRGAPGDRRYIEDAINVSQTSDVLIARNYLRDGDADTGCGIIAGDNYGGSPGNGITIIDNTVMRTSNCGIGVAGGANHVVTRNRVLDPNFAGGTGNVGLYVWDYRNLGTCFGITVSDNIVSNLLPDGTYGDYWDAGNCRNVTVERNVFGDAARRFLTPEPQPPPVPPLPYVSAVSPARSQR
jgi:hypothetical protein